MANDNDNQTLTVVITRLPIRQIEYLRAQKAQTGLPIERQIRNALDNYYPNLRGEARKGNRA